MGDLPKVWSFEAVNFFSAIVIEQRSSSQSFVKNIKKIEPCGKITISVVPQKQICISKDEHTFVLSVY